ncbi:MAG: hypothetical protein VX288_05745 [Planctomycetota bacterium]|nr:hypothetical protein [Planctomycetota bacterium]
MRVSAATSKTTGQDAGETGYVTSTITDGELFLRGPKNRVYRLEWKPGAGHQRLALPPGHYTITGYRIARTDKQGKRWFLSASSHGHRKLKVAAGKTKKIELDQRIHLSTSATTQSGNLRGSMMISGDSTAGQQGKLLRAPRRIGLSVYRSGKRIPISYRILDNTGSELASGNMNYG